MFHFSFLPNTDIIAMIQIHCYEKQKKKERQVNMIINKITEEEVHRIIRNVEERERKFDEMERKEVPSGDFFEALDRGMDMIEKSPTRHFMFGRDDEGSR